MWYMSPRFSTGEISTFDSRNQLMAIKVGQKAPAFTLPDADGDSVRLTDLAGQWVVVYFYPKDDTPG